MLETSARLLRLLSVLQSRRFWSGADLAAHLEVTPRTLRRDIDRLRSLGYAVEATAGHGGGYQLGKGAALPPLLLDDEEAVAVAVALRSVTDTYAGAAETAVRVLAKLEQLLPARLRSRLGAIHAMTVSVRRSKLEAIDPDLLTTLAAACRDCQRVEFAYRNRAGEATTRRVEPLRLAHTAWRSWYLVAWDLDRGAWRTFRVDRIEGAARAGERFVPRPAPEDVAAWVADSLSRVQYPYRARIKLQGTLEELAATVPPWCGTLERLDDRHCTLDVGSETLDGLVCHIVLCGQEFELLEPADLAPHLEAVAARLVRAANGALSRRAG